MSWLIWWLLGANTGVVSGTMGAPPVVPPPVPVGELSIGADALEIGGVTLRLG